MAPFLQLTTHPSRSFSPCPYLGGTTWSKRYPSITETWNSPELESLRQDFLNNNKSPICGRCWDEESYGKRSLRLRLLDPETLQSDYKMLQDPAVVKSMLESVKDGSYHNGPRLLSIKNGNVCNAKCRTCHPGDSSRWIADAKKLFDITQQATYRINVREVNWDESQIEEIFALTKNLIRLELFGGEPTYNKKVIALLNRMVESGTSKNISLYINTNGSVNIVDKIPGLHQFKEIDIGISIDAVGDQFEYIRHGLNYSQIVSNVQQWQQYFQHHHIPSTITSITTVGILNVYYLPEIKKAVVDLLGTEPFWNLLVDPDFLCIKTLPQQVKDIVIKHLEHDQSFAEIVTMLKQPYAPRSWAQFLQLTNALDSIRGERFAKIFPEFHDIIQQHGMTGSDLDAIDFGKVIVYVGDCEHPQGWYLRLLALEDHPTATKLTTANCKDIQPGVYYTSLHDLGTNETFLSVLEQADRIVYREPSYWQDTPGAWWQRLLKFKSPSKKIIEKTLQQLISRKTIQGLA